MHVVTIGREDAPAMLLLHGAAACDCFAGQYDCLSAHFRLFIPHLPGAGEAVGEIYDRETTLRDLTALIETLPRPLCLMGHSIGGELAVALVARGPERFSRAVFLSPWVCATRVGCNRCERLAPGAGISFKWSGLVRMQGKYWGYTDAQADYMAAYAAHITPAQYAAWFRYENRVHLDEETGYPGAAIPMLAICGKSETAEMKRSVQALAQRNAHCRSLQLPGGHDFPQRNAKELNPLLLEFLLEK